MGFGGIEVKNWGYKLQELMGYGILWLKLMEYRIFRFFLWGFVDLI